MRAAIVLTVASIISSLSIAAASAEASAGARYGELTIGKSITLSFPQPGEYKGRVELRKRKVTQNARNRFGRRAGPKNRGAAKRRALAFCRSSLLKTPVRVVHLVKPPFPIGMAKPKKHGHFYRVLGPQPPIGDLVRASQRATRKGFAVGSFRWEVRCAGAKIVKPYG